MNTLLNFVNSLHSRVEDIREMVYAKYSNYKDKEYGLKNGLAHAGIVCAAERVEGG